MKKKLDQPRRSEKGLDDIGLPAEPLLSMTEFLLRGSQVRAAEILKFYPFQIVLNTLVVAQFRAVSGELLQVNAHRRPLGQKFRDHRSLARRGPGYSVPLGGPRYRCY